MMPDAVYIAGLDAGGEPAALLCAQRGDLCITD